MLEWQALKWNPRSKLRTILERVRVMKTLRVRPMECRSEMRVVECGDEPVLGPEFWQMRRARLDQSR